MANRLLECGRLTPRPTGSTAYGDCSTRRAGGRQHAYRKTVSDRKSYAEFRGGSRRSGAGSLHVARLSPHTPTGTAAVSEFEPELANPGGTFWLQPGYRGWVWSGPSRPGGPVGLCGGAKKRKPRQRLRSYSEHFAQSSVDMRSSSVGHVADRRRSHAAYTPLLATCASWLSNGPHRPY